MVYVGRVANPEGVSSWWANPFRVGRDGSRSQVVEKFCDHIKKGKAKEGIEGLAGKTLVCQCREDQECHADVLIDLVKELEERLDTVPHFNFPNKRRHANGASAC